MISVKTTKPLWINGDPFDAGAVIVLRDRIALDLIQTGAAKPETNQKTGKTNGKSSTKDQGTEQERKTETS